MAKTHPLSDRIVCGDKHTTAHFNAHLKRWGGCTKCLIGVRSINHVFARGKLPCDVLFVGEGPGRQEDESGFPFVGASGEVLDDWIKYATDAPGAPTWSWAITNTVACRPQEYDAGRGTFGNRPPTFKEVNNCAPRFDEMLAVAQPKAVVLIGRIASEYSIEWRGNYAGRALELYHPSYILRTGGRRSATSQQQAAKLYNFVCGLANTKVI